MKKLIAWLGLLLVGIGVSACAPGEPLIIETPTAEITLTPSATIEWFPPTNTPAVVPVQEFFPSPTPLAGLGQEILSDSFSASSPWTVVKNTTGSAAIGKNELTLAISAPKGYLTSLRDAPELDDFYLEITVIPNLCRPADSYGLLLRAANDQNLYRWVITCGGQTRLERVRGNISTPIQDWLDSGDQRLGSPVKNKLGVWAYGSTLRFYINGSEIFSLRDPVFTSGKPGLFARSGGDTAVTVSFSELVVRAIDPASLPTPTPQPSATPTK